jgi:hypothetical protein
MSVSGRNARAAARVMMPKLRLLVGAAISGLIWIVGSPAQASELTACVSTYFGEQAGHSKCDTKATFTAEVDLSDGFQGATAHGLAGAGGAHSVPFSEFINPSLYALATGTQSDDGDIFTAGGATASAMLTDTLVYDDPILFSTEFLGLDPYIYFLFGVHGSISNHIDGGFGASVVSTTGQVYAHDEIFHGPGSFGEVVRLRLPGNALLRTCRADEPECEEFDPTFTLSLTLSGGTDLNNQDGSSDFSDTVVLNSVYLGDADGHPLPGSDRIHVVGDLGVYAGFSSATPEPTAWALMIMGFGLAGAGLRRGRNLAV